AGLNVGIGTDGPASNNDLDMFEEVRLAAFVAKAVTNDPTSLPASTALAMATRLGARALHLGDVTGALVPGLRADLIVVDLAPLHNSPSFRRAQENVYAQLVYAAKSVDVTDVMCNGRWLMRDHRLLTVQEDVLLAEAARIAKKIDAFLIQREGSIVSKLIALGGSMEQESFEVQLKVRIQDRQAIRESLKQSAIQTVRYRHYGQHDTYLNFDDPAEGRLRYREDDFLEETGAVTSTRRRLTLLGRKRERKFEHDVLLSRSRFFAPATQSLRFYREYFRPTSETVITKDRERWLINFRGTEFFINLDEMREPALGQFVEIKSRTWSRRDAEHKAALTGELLQVLGLDRNQTVASDYVDAVEPAA
ncbi:MAG TPA: amidohydrolase family protein, partial [Anaerolineales bacterium]|nr:amidohydrolase family protein [Anaerolineales bacterium]